MRRIGVCIAALALLAALIGCGSSDSSTVSGNGTIRFEQIEGGFYGIVSDDTKAYDPDVLPVDFKQDGLRVHFDVTPLNTPSPHQWGTAVHVVNLTKI